MIDHVEWQMRNLEGGLEGKLEDWVKQDHQEGARRRAQFCTTRDQDRPAVASEKAQHGVPQMQVCNNALMR